MEIIFVDNISFVYTLDSDCEGCNKCIFTCPTHANEAHFEADCAKVSIKDGFCISCGECIAICDHKARDYFDDTSGFFEAIKNGEEISVVIAPAARFNVTDVSKLITYLKSIGVNKVYDVSFGADICTWAHVKMLKENKIDTIISQPCPVVVSYIEKYRPEIINKLSPIQSPVICVATYLKKYLKIKDKIMFLSPCIGKKRECKSTYTLEALDYNVTFAKFMERLENNNVDLNSYESSKFDNMEGSIGFTFSRPGGLNENIKFNLDEDVWIKQIEGIHKLVSYIDEYLDDVKNNRPVPVIIDALNCEGGCNLGTGTNKQARQNEIDYVFNKSKTYISREKADELTEYFNKMLNVEDFVRRYKDRSFDYKKRDDVDIERAFIQLGKFTEVDRNINCFSCGYGNCYDFAYDLALGHNDRNNCRHYLLNKFKKMSLYDDLTGINNRNCYNMLMKRLDEHHPGFVGVTYIDINGLKDANDTHGHSYGDELIIACARILNKVFTGKCYRVGGDEFVIMYDENDEDEFVNRLEKLNELLAKEEKLIVSVGTAISYTKEDLIEKMELADKLMYKNKQEYYNSINKADRRNRRSLKKIFK